MKVGGNKMKGVILAGGSGTRLDPITRVYNKHLIPVNDKPMIFYPLMTLINSGVKDILIVTGGKKAGDFLELLGNGSEFGLKHLEYTYQKGSGGIAEALGLAREFIDNHNMMVILGDNFYENSFYEAVNNFKSGSKIFLKQVHDPQRFGVAEIKEDRVINIVEKPEFPKTNLAVTGLYVYDPKVFDIIKNLKPSHRGELEITDVNNAYINNNEMQYEILNGFWSDMGKFESIRKTCEFLWSKKD